MAARAVKTPDDKRVRLRQCKACPWKKSTTPEADIPGGYCSTKHANLADTIAPPGIPVFGDSMKAMACHESPRGAEQMCVGWVAHQLGPGNNIALRMMAMDGRFQHIRTFGPQHECFEDTLPKEKRG